MSKIVSGNFFNDIKRMFGFLWKHTPRYKRKGGLLKRIKRAMSR